MFDGQGEDMDKILGLEYGADDYITKPFNISGSKGQKQSYVEAHITGCERRRIKKVVENVRGLKIDCEKQSAYSWQRSEPDSVKEFDLLELLVFHPNKVYSREDLLNTVWDMIIRGCKNG